MVRRICNETNALAVANKQVDVATNNTENLDKLKTSAPEKLKELKVIWKSPLIPGDPIVWRKNLSETTKDKIYDFFMNYGKTPEEKAVLERLGWAPFRASSDLQLVPIRQLALFKENRAFPRRTDSGSASNTLRGEGWQESYPHGENS